MKHLDPPKAGHPVGSPCISVCRMDQSTGWCEGCLRSIDEIVAWGRYTPQERLQVWRDLNRRAAILAGSSGAS
jgi:hypothetical protein